MKKFWLVVLSLIFLAIIVTGAILAFSSYNNDQKDGTPSLDSFPAGQGTHFGLTAETEAKIKQDYLSFDVSTDPVTTAEDVVLRYYYGTYDGSVATKIGYWFYGYLAVIIYEHIDGITITYPSTHKILVWNDGNFYNLQEAYDNGLLTKDDIQRIADILPLFWSEEKQIRQGYVDAYVKLNVPEATADGVWIELNYGKYYNELHSGNTTVLMMWHKDEGTSAAIREVYVGDVKFIYSNGYSITVWNNESFYGLQDAFDQGLLTKEDIIKISELHKAAYPNLYTE